jgi:membrane protein required for colicin V production
MLIDILFAIVIVLAIIKGYKRGLIVGLFSFIAILIGLAAAIKLSALVANYLGDNVKISIQWLPVISFVIVFIIVVWLVRLGAKAIEGLAESVMLGWVNRIGGIIFFIAIYTAVFSVGLFYAEQIKLLQPAATKSSATYPIVHPLGPRAVNAIGKTVPVFKDMFAQLEDFFEGVSQKVAEK